MTRTLIVLIGLALAGVAQAQIKCWTTADGKRGCGDTPPPGAKVRTIKGALTAPAPAAAKEEDAGKDAKKGPLTAAEREQEYRRRQDESKKEAAKEEQEKKELAAKAQNCERARESLRALLSGQRVVRTNSEGERYFLDQKQIAQQTTQVRDSIQKNCN